MEQSRQFRRARARFVAKLDRNSDKLERRLDKLKEAGATKFKRDTVASANEYPDRRYDRDAWKS